MSRDLLVSVSPGEIWAAEREGEDLTRLDILRAAAGQPGEVILGRVVALKPELPAALVAIGLDRPGFLSAEDVEPRGALASLQEGQAILVQIVKAARADKAAGLTMRPRLRGRRLDLTPSRPGIAAAKALPAAERERLTAALAGKIEAGEGYLLRAGAEGADPAELAVEAAMLRARWRAIEAASGSARPPARLEDPAPPLARLLDEAATAPPDRIVVDDRAAFAEARRWLGLNRPELVDRLELHREATPLFEEEGVAGAIAELLQPRVALPGGGALTIEPTAAATLIDVDTGGAAVRGRWPEEAILAANLAAARAVARQVLLRNLAGPIVIDFVGMRRREHRAQVRDLMAALLAEEEGGEVLGWTRLGHLELVRPRRRPSLAELLFERAPGGGWIKTPLTVALEALRALQREAAARPVRAMALEVHPAVAAALDGPAQGARRELEARLGLTLAVTAAPGRPREGFDIRLD